MTTYQWDEEYTSTTSAEIADGQYVVSLGKTSGDKLLMAGEMAFASAPGEKMAGMTITIKGEGAYAIIDGKKYEAVNGVLEVKLPAKTGKIPVIIGNAGTKAGTFSITVATPSEDNSDTGDNAAIVLFGSLMALSIMATAVLLIPNIRKKLMNK